MVRRPDGVVTQDRIDNLQRLIRGFRPPSGFQTDKIPGREGFAELTDDELNMVANGYMCGNGDCLAVFRIPLVTCPACFTPTGPQNIVAKAPPEWTEHRKARETAPATPRLGRGPQSPDAWLERMMGDPDAEHTTISKLKKRRKG
jgi:hypothetical protein